MAINDKTRGTTSNPHNRFSPTSVEAVDDGWWQETDVTPRKTEHITDRGKTIITTNRSPDLPFRQSINPYRGCEHGCIYCYARPSHAYWDMSPGLDFETKIIVKPNAAQLLKAQLEKPGYQCETIVIGANTDPYQPSEIQFKTTRSLLKVLQQFRHPFSIITKSALIVRDLDIIEEMSASNLCSVAVSVTTLSNDLKRKLEPRTASPAARLKTIKTLSEAGVDVTLMAAPIIPVVNDHELEAILDRGKQAGARSASYIFLRLPREVDVLFETWLREHFPDRADHVLNIVMQSRGGKRYESAFHTRMKGEGVFAQLIKQRFDLAVRKLGLNQEMTGRFSLDTSQFVRPTNQLSLF